MSIEVKGVSKIFERNENKALHNIDLNINTGEFVCLLGPSGCGKSTLMNMIAGFFKPTEGNIYIDGEIVDKPTIDRVTIFQNYGLLPWRTVEKNVQLGLESQKLAKKERKELSDKYINLVGLQEFKNSYPSELSGGMKQRVAIARALAVRPKVLFMDEPFAALDPVIRVKLQEDLINIWKKEKMTVIFVTHDVEEAIFLGTKIVIMAPHPGRVKQVIDNPIEKTVKRSGTEFYGLKDKIFHFLQSNANEKVEYYI
ncbi:MAG: ABC transporter ATP-binding protein [Clostridium sp.]|uniref:ABC transporter ATP-binding protein n=1 Tax=Clostridium sp. DSM 8431 TaxID=1761781 RepID=UPI0008E679FC|nr:ABC transporter ATP-binding protein [Clostridium sp. DSM 8431]MCR4944411.1 ABC transporter ATP-binding protein [Clostridium sp.]SFU58296.1 NitT/TauT family transport system ATP-binding protein [Clostridium sp. DSM 8431]